MGIRLLISLGKLHGNQFPDFFGKTCLNRPADSLRCLPVTAVRPVPYRNLQSNDTKFSAFRTVLFFSDGGQRFSLRGKSVLIAHAVKGNSLFPLTIPFRQAEPA